MKGRQKRRPTEVDRLNNLWVGRQGFSLLRTRTLRRFRALRAALANAHAFTQLRALSGSNPCRGKKSGRHPPVAFLFYGGPSGVRTLDLGIKSPLLCQLS